MVSTNYNQRFGAAAGGIQASPIHNIGTSSVGFNKIGLNSTGGAGFNSQANYSGIGSGAAANRVMRTISNETPQVNPAMIGGNSGIGTGPIRPPLYVPSKRDSGRNVNPTD